MDNKDIMLQKIQEKNIMETKQILQNLGDLQKRNITPEMSQKQQQEEYISHILENEQLHNSRFLDKVQKNVNSIKATGTAENEPPIQQQKPAKETWKERKKREKRAKQANKKTPGADHISMDMSEAVREAFKNHNNAMEDNNAYQRAEKAGVDVRVLRNFTYGYRKDKQGNPLTEMDTRFKEADKNYIDDYLSCNVKKRKKHLDRILNQMVDYAQKFSTKDRFSLDYIKRNITSVFDYNNKLTYFENVKNDPINAEYFAGLSKHQKERLKMADNKSSIKSTIFSTIVGLKGVNINSGEFTGEIPELYHEILKAQMPALEEAIKENKQMQDKQDEFEKNVVDDMVNKFKKNILDTSEKMRKEAEIMVKEDYQGLNNTSYVTGNSFDELAKYRKMIKENTEKYEENKQIVDKIYQNLHHTIDSMGEKVAILKALQKITDNISDNKELARDERVRIQSIAIARQEEEGAKVDMVRDYIASYADVLKHILKDAPLSVDGERILNNLKEENK